MRDKNLAVRIKIVKDPAPASAVIKAQFEIPLDLSSPEAIAPALEKFVAAVKLIHGEERGSELLADLRNAFDEAHGKYQAAKDQGISCEGIEFAATRSVGE